MDSFAQLLSLPLSYRSTFRKWYCCFWMALLGFGSAVSAAPPDLTAGGLPTDAIYWNLGPTGMQGWFYHVSASTADSRQILVSVVDAGSPAYGVLAVNDVILGADGTGATPVNFISDARKALADAIADAEARSPATLKLRRWRAGVITTVAVTLQTLGAYSATAPYNCPKSAAILEKGLDAIMASGETGGYMFSTMTLLASNDPANPKNAFRQSRAMTEARSLNLTAAQIAEYTSGNSSYGVSKPWSIGHQLMMQAEYYLQTGDAQVLPSIWARALLVANGQSMFGTTGHQFAKPALDGSINGPYGVGYGTVNNANMGCFTGLVLAKKCGLTDPEILAGIERASRFYGAYVNRGSIPYGEHEPGGGHESNGKCGQAAIAFLLKGDRSDAAAFFAKMATASATSRDGGHTGPYFNYQWAPLGANVGGEQTMAAYFSRARWMYDLARKWNGTFEYNTYGQGSNGGNDWSSSNFQMSTAILLTYALPLRQTYITGKNQNPADWLSEADANAAADAADYNAASRTTNQLLTDLGSWSPPNRKSAASELGLRTAEHASLLPTLHAMAADTGGGNSRVGACYALKAIANDSSAPVLGALLTDSDSKVRFAAAQSFRYLSLAARQGQLTTLLKAVVATSKPVLPLDEDDPLHQDNGQIGMALFYPGGASGAAGVIKGNGIIGVDRALLYPAIRAVAANPVGLVRSCLNQTYLNLTKADVDALADVLVDTVNFEAPADRMFSGGVRTGGLQTLGKHNVSEGVPLARILYPDFQTESLDVLKGYAGSSLGVLPDPKIVEFCEFLTQADPDFAASAQAVLDAIKLDTNPKTITPFKSIQTVTASAPLLTLPSKWTTLHVNAVDLAKGNTVYTWRKVHGAGNVTFTPNGASAGKDSTVFFDGTPGQYLFEVKMSDSRNFTEVYRTVAVTLKDSGGNLPTNNPPTATPQSLTIGQGSPTPIVLAGNDPEGLPMNFSITGQPAHGQLTGVLPNVVYTSLADYTGSDSFTFTVMDSVGQVANATVSITVSTASAIGVAVYEPFNYPAAGLNGATDAGSVGFSSAWNAPTQTTVAAGSLAYGSLTPLGGSISELGTGGFLGGARTISSSALSANGLLADGVTLWFSALIGPGTDSWGNAIQFALANNSFSSSNRSNIMDDGAQLGSGIGLSISKSGGGAVVAAQFKDATLGTDINYGSWDDSQGLPFSVDHQYRMIVGKIVWGAASDTIEIYQPKEDLFLPLTPISTLTTNVDQSIFDTITFSRSNAVMLDEIRFGASYQSVLQGTTPMTPDHAAPLPNPMTFDLAATPSGSSSISMVAATAFDPTGVEYYFTCTSGGGHDSGWQVSPSYTDTGLTPGLLYSYTVKARDKSPAHNETAASAVSSATIPTQATTPDLTGMPQVAAESAILGAGLTVGSVTNDYSPTVPPGSVISQTPVGSTVLAYGSPVDLVVSLGFPRISPADFVDDKGGATVVPNALVTYTLTFSWDMDDTTVNSDDFSNAGTAAINIGNITEISPGVFTVQVTPTNDGSLRLQISAGATLLDFGARAVDTASAIVDDTVIWFTTDLTPPSPNLPTWAAVPTALSQTQVTMTVAVATDDHGPVEYFFQNTTNGSYSGWTTSTTWLNTGLNQNTSYGYQVKARDVLNNQTSWSAVVSVTTPPEADPPLVASFDPADNATDVSLGTNFTVTFNETIKKGTGSITIRNITDGTNTTISVTDTTQVTVSGTVLTINPTGFLLGNKNYAILMPAGMVKDSVNNNFAGISLETTWNFTSGPSDAIPPAITTLSPADSATGVGLASNLVATFNEEIVKGTGNITLRNLTDVADVLIPVTDATQVSISGMMLIINPSTTMDPNKDYAIRMDAGAIFDKSGNAFGGITDDTTWNLHTITPPSLSIHTGNSTNTTDSWNTDTNWDSGSGHAPAGPTSVEIATSKIAVANSVSTSPYTGNLTIGSGAALKVYKNTQDLNALGSGTVSMKSGSNLSFLNTQTRTISRPIQLSGNASITTGASTGGAVNATFTAPIDGTFNLVLTGNGSSQNHLAVANSFDGLTASPVSTNSWDLNWQVYADAAGSLGLGNVTINNTVSLVVNANNPMVPSATLSLSGLKSSKVASKVVMNANDTIKALFIDGVQQPDGVYDTSSSWLTGTGILTVGSAGGVDIIRPTLVSIVDDQSGGPTYTNSPVTYTVTFSEDMDASTITTSDFGNAGTCNANFGAISKTAPGVFTVQVTPTSTGTLIFWVPAGAVLKDLAGNAVVTSTAILDDTTITVTTPPDLIPPAVVSLNPPDDTTGVAVWASMTVTFDEGIKKGTGTITLRNLTNSTDTVINVTDATQVAISGSVLTIHPATNLLAAKSYAIRISSGAITDLSGNPFAGIANDTAWNFDTVLVEPIATFTGVSKSNGDNWNVATNWTPGAVPSGAISVVIPDGKYATADIVANPTYLGNLSIGVGATLQCGYTGSFSQTMNALGTAGSTTISMKEGSAIVMRGAFSPSVPKIDLLGNAKITIGTSSSGSPTPTFASGINGPYVLTVTGKSGTIMNLTTVTNTFNKIVFDPNSGSNFTINANVTGALGGDVTILATPTGTITANLVLGAANAISNSAKLILSGPASATKLKISAPNTVTKLVLDGVQQPGGTYGKVGSGAQYQVAWINSTSTNDYLTVIGSPASYWDINANTAGAGGSAPSGIWDLDTNANWSTAVDGSGATDFWSVFTGQTAVFSAGADATGSYAVTITGTQDIGGLRFEEGNVTLSDGGLRMTSDSLLSVASGSTSTLGSVISNDTTHQLTKGGVGSLVLSGANTYTGNTRLEAGTLSIASLTNSGANSPIGNYPSAGAGGLTLAGGIFRYTGGTASTNRGLTLSGNATLDVNSATTALTLGDCESLDGPGILTLTGGGSSSLSMGQFRIVEGAGVTLNPTTIPITVASVNGFTSYPNQSELVLGGATVGNVITGNVSVTNPLGSAFTQQIRVTKSDTSSWTIAGVFSSGGTLTVNAGTLTLSGTNTYTGVTAVLGGTLIAGTNAPNNANGAFGKLNNSDVTLGVAGGNNPAAVLIGGAYTIGRPIRIPTTNISDIGARVLTLGGNTAHNSAFSGSIYLGTNGQAGRGVTLTAVNGGTVTFSGVIQDPTTMDATTYTVTKSGEGTVAFTNNNTYTGNTLVSEGSLAMIGGSQTSAISVASGASLGFTLGSPTTTTQSVALTTGTVKITGSVDNVSNYRLMTANLGFTGSLTLSSPISNYALQLQNSSTELWLVYTGGPGPLHHFAISAIGSPQTVGTPINGITLTAQDAANNTITNFTDTVTFGGAGGFTGTSSSFIGGILTGVSVTPTVAGSNLTFTVTDGAIPTAHTGTTTITTIQTQYDGWANGSLFDSDANGDGIKNGLAFLLGASGPNSSVTLPVATQSSGNLVLNFTCRKIAYRAGAVLKLQSSNDLGVTDPWSSHEALVPDSNTTVNGVVFVISANADPNYVNILATIPGSTGSNLYGRLSGTP